MPDEPPTCPDPYYAWTLTKYDWVFLRVQGIDPECSVEFLPNRAYRIPAQPQPPVEDGA